VIHNQPGIVIGNHPPQLRLEGEAARVVDDLGAQLQRALGHFGLIGIHRNRQCEPVLQPLEHGNQAAQFLRRANGPRAGAGGFGADIDDVGALFFQFESAREGAVGFSILAAVGKRIGRHVEHAH
jgi:hypothetical protein